MTNETLQNQEVLNENMEQVDEQTPPASEEVLTENVEQEPTKTAEDLAIEIDKLNNKKIEVIGKLKAEKTAHLQTKTEMENLQTELEQLRNIKQELDDYKVAQHEMMVLYALNVIPEYMDYMQFELKKQGYKVGYVDGIVLQKQPPKKIGTKIIDGAYDQVQMTGYAFLNPNGELVGEEELRELQNKYARYIFAYNNIYGKKEVNLDGVKTVAIAENYLQEAKKSIKESQNSIEFYQRQIIALEEHKKQIAKAENSVIPIQFGLQ
ncbi:hypothetical protein AAX05_06110 [Moraxella bovoculi]|uniref:Uncharacterized protein n=1 Tax=Moraxella bovoculi TaxID=386891 RepID=A0AAC8T9N7_9GAMM|nr:hypothetical protein [Moraxella bovoculi]AKG07596.1 hypothetical protein AAX06_04840 [Moraxella bovoculi]AKG09802.1 hypothetical protein AAX05_06110 [Moraxella bovoculi]AKG11720.1 hypothetical protein AAX07_06665 [Moraxella bovoculi]AKG13687.1 hypothetical protein AAX11_06195 [Moraxella bovoculi]